MAVEVDTGSANGTPTQESRKRKAGTITVAQKQALADNLQLEVTERARKLRAQYALHAQHLRSRLEMRVQRIPQTLRTTSVDELIDKYATQQARPKPGTAASKPARDLGSKVAEKLKQAQVTASPGRVQGKKRPSAELSGDGDDKENADMNLGLPKKRSRAEPDKATTTRAGRAASRKVVPSQVLSPKSNNSRTLPRSPVKPSPSSPPKPYTRPFSPLKPAPAAAGSEHVKPGPRAASRAGPAGSRPATAAGTRGRKAAAPAAKAAQEVRGRNPSDGSGVSDSSAGTTIIKRKTPAPRKGVASKVAGAAAGVAAAATKGRAAAKKEAAVPTTGGRVLRARR